MKNGLVKYADGDKFWYKEDKLHREDGPAVECINGYKAWFKEGLRHRDDGPAVVYVNGNKFWYFHGIKIKVSSQEEFKKMIKMKVFW